MAKKSSRRRHSLSPSLMNASAGMTPSREVDLVEEYRYVIEDLKRIGIIAAVLIGMLIGLSFFL